MIIFFLAFLIRLILIPLPGFKADIAYWKWWGMSAAHDGISGPLINTAYNYPSFYLYILKATSHIYEFFTGYNFKLDPQNAVFWNDSNLLYLFLIKLPYILADLGIGILIFLIVRNALIRPDLKHGEKRSGLIGLFASSLFLFNPVVIYNSSIWGQTDSLGSFFVLLAFYSLLTARYSLLSVFSAIALFMKTQTLVFLPILFLGVAILCHPERPRAIVEGESRDIFQIKSGVKDSSATFGGLGMTMKEIIKSLWIFTATIIVINLPFLLTHTMSRVLEIMYTSQLYFPYVSLNAYNLWWLFFGRASINFWDQNLIAGLITFKTAGFILFAGVYGLGMALILQASQKDPTLVPPQQGRVFLRALLNAFILISLAFFILLTQMHERYLFPLFVFYPILLGITYCSSVSENFSLRSKNIIILSTFYFLLSLTTLLNLHQVMVMNYPDNTLPFFPNTFSEPLSRVIAFINLITFIILLFFLTRSLFPNQKSFLKIKMASVRPSFSQFLPFYAIAQKGRIKFLIFFLPAIALATAGLLSLVVFFRSLTTPPSPISLISLKPISLHQDFGSLQVNKNLSNNWLSSIYYFFPTGLATHAHSQIVYNLNGQYKTFTTNFGIDTDASENASVIFKIIGDGKILFQSPKMGRYNPPRFAKVNVSDVKKLELLVEDAGDGINSDHADWLNPMVYK